MYPLPPYARQIEFLESTGTQWIDTELEYFPDFEIGCKMRESVGNVTIGINQAWAFSRNSATDPTWKLLANNRTFKTSVPVTSYVDASYKNGSFVANGTAHTSSEPNQFVSGHMLVFTRGSNLPASYPAVLYYLKCYDWNGNLVRSFIPCRILDVGYLWDEVEGKFYGNNGTGDFVLGSDIREGVLPTRFNPFGIGRRMETIRQVEYLEATGTQWIDLGVSVSDPSTITIEADETVCQQIGFTHQNNANGTWIARYAPPSIPESLYIYHNKYTNRNIVPANEDRKISKYDGSSGYYENGTQIANFVASVGSDAIANINWCYGAVYDFQMNAVDTRSLRSGKIYSIKIYVSGELVRDFKPVRAGTTGYLLDKVSGELFGNAGTGDFICGGDL